MTREQMILELNTAIILLDSVEVRREENMSNQLSSISRVRAVRDALREEKKNEERNDA